MAAPRCLSASYLGNSSTLRGWNKYDLDPLGGNRLVYGSVTYGYHIMRVFYDTGSVWDQGRIAGAAKTFGRHRSVERPGGLAKRRFSVGAGLSAPAGPRRSGLDRGNEFLTIRPKCGKVAHAIFAALACAGLVCLELLALSVPATSCWCGGYPAMFTSPLPTCIFLPDQSLQRLHDGAVVPFDFQLTIAAGAKNNVVTRALERFTVSYDVWQEKFSVTRLRDFRKSSLNLSANGRRNMVPG